MQQKCQNLKNKQQLMHISRRINTFQSVNYINFQQEHPLQASFKTALLLIVSEKSLLIKKGSNILELKQIKKIWNFLSGKSV